MTTGRINQVAVRTRGGSLSPRGRLGSRVQLVPGTDKVPYDIRFGTGVPASTDKISSSVFVFSGFSAEIQLTWKLEPI